MLTGYAYPFAVDGNGSLKLASDADYLRQQIVSYLETERRERLGLPQYGLRDYLFQSNDASMSAEIEAGLKRFIPQCGFTVRTEPTDLGETLVEVFWTWAGDDQESVSLLFAM